MSDDEQFNRQSKQLLDESVQSLEDPVVRRLNQARAEALQAYEKRQRGFPMMRWQVMLPTAAAVVMAFGVWFQLGENGHGNGLMVPEQIAAMEDLEILTGTENLELMDELEFYVWLSEQDHAG